MSRPDLTVIAGASRRQTRKLTPAQDALAKRWRLGGLGVSEPEPVQNSDVIPLLDGWIRRLEREAADPTIGTR